MQEMDTTVSRRALLGTIALAGSACAGAARPDARWHEAALEMQRIAESKGDQPYGAVLVRDGALIGEGPSRVVLKRDPDAHAEREAIADAVNRFGNARGAALYSTSRPCARCEAAAAAAGVARMYYGATLTDAGAPGIR
jgi:tRNA(adenine34) deaminase